MIHLYALCCHYSAILHHTLLFLFVLIVFVLWQLITSFLVYDCSLLYLPFTVLLFYLYISAPHSSRSPLAILLPWCCLLWQSKGFLYFSTLKLSPQCFAATLLNILTECQESNCHCKGNCNLKKCSKCQARSKALKYTGRGSEEERMGITLLAWSNIRTDM